MLPAAVVVASVLATFDAVTRNQTRDLSLVGCGTFLMSSVIVTTPGTVFFSGSMERVGFEPTTFSFSAERLPHSTTSVQRPLAGAPELSVCMPELG